MQLQSRIHLLILPTEPGLNNAGSCLSDSKQLGTSFYCCSLHLNSPPKETSLVLNQATYVSIYPMVHSLFMNIYLMENSVSSKGRSFFPSLSQLNPSSALLDQGMHNKNMKYGEWVGVKLCNGRTWGWSENRAQPSIPT